MAYKHILVAVDLSSSSQAVIDKATALAEDANAILSFAYIDVDRVVLELVDVQELHDQLNTLADASEYPVTHRVVERGDLHIKLESIVSELAADLVVCGHHHGLLSRLFSPVPKLANSIEADLLVVYLSQE